MITPKYAFILVLTFNSKNNSQKYLKFKVILNIFIWILYLALLAYKIMKWWCSHSSKYMKRQHEAPEFTNSIPHSRDSGHSLRTKEEQSQLPPWKGTSEQTFRAPLDPHYLPGQGQNQAFSPHHPFTDHYPHFGRPTNRVPPTDCFSRCCLLWAPRCESWTQSWGHLGQGLDFL